MNVTFHHPSGDFLVCHTDFLGFTRVNQLNSLEQLELESGRAHLKLNGEVVATSVMLALHPELFDLRGVNTLPAHSPTLEALKT